MAFAACLAAALVLAVLPDGFRHEVNDDGAETVDGGLWHIYVVDDKNDSLGFTSLALDRFGSPHIAYSNWTSHDGVTRQLKYAKWDGYGWKTEMIDLAFEVGHIKSLAVGSNGVVHISYFAFANWTTSPLKHASRNGIGWSIEAVGFGKAAMPYSSLVLDKSDNPHIAYRGLNATKYASWNGTAWGIETVPTGDVGSVQELALDSQDYPHITYINHTSVPAPDKYLKYARWNGTAWNVEDMAGEQSDSSSAPIDLDSHDYPHIAFMRGFTRSGLGYAKWNGTGWTVEYVDQKQNVGFYPSIKVDSKDRPHISYYDGINHALKYAFWTGTNWSIETVDSSAAVGGFTSLALDADDLPHISYLDGTNRNLKYATKAHLKPPPGPALSHAPATVDFGAMPRDTIDTRTFEVWNSGGGTLDYRFSKNVTWITAVTPASGSSAGERDLVTVTVDTTGLSVGLHAATISVLSNGGNGTVGVSVNVTAPSRQIRLDIDPDTLNLKSKGKWITAYLIVENGTAGDVDPSTLLLNDIVRPEWWDMQGDTTLMVKFDRAAVQAIVPVSDSVDVKVTGQWNDGGSLEAHDTIRVIDP